MTALKQGGKAMSTELINLELSRRLQDRLDVMQSQKPDFYPKFLRIIKSLLMLDQSPLSAEQASQVVAKKQYALSKISKVLGFDEEEEIRRKFQQRLANLCVDLNEIWSDRQAEAGGFDFANSLKTFALWLFESFKGQQRNIPLVPKLEESSPELAISSAKLRPQMQ
jgi:hypothetical protein